MNNSIENKFKAALALDGKNMRVFAEERGVTAVAVFRVVKGHSVSSRLTKEIVSYTESVFRGAIL